MKHALLSTIKISTALLLVVVTGIFAYLITPMFGNKVLIVRSGSMTPSLPVGSLVAIRPKEALVSPLPAVPLYSPGDTISFKDPSNPKTITTHRVVGMEIKNDQILYQTKGDANEAPDQTLVNEKNVLGATFLTVPYLGQLFSFTKTAAGFLLLVLMPAIFVILLESWNIIKELRKKKPIPYFYLKDFKPSVKQSPTLTSLVPLLAIGLVLTQTSAYFSDSASSTSNVFAASQTFPTNHLVINEVLFKTTGGDCGSSTAAEWIEIYNPTNASVNLNNWKVGDNTATDDLPDVTLNPNSFAIVSNCTEADFTTQYGTTNSALFIELATAIGSSGFNAGGDTARLLDSNSNNVDLVSWGSDTTAFSPSVDPPTPTNHSIERDPTGTDTDTAVDWVDKNPPTPGN